MSLSVIKTGSYDTDLEHIWLFLRDQYSLDAAGSTLREIESRVELLGDFPDMGERQPQFGANCRRILAAKKYVVFYERWEDRIEVLRVLHSAQQVDRLA